jgi:hypothetical protein
MTWESQLYLIISIISIGMSLVVAARNWRGRGGFPAHDVGADAGCGLVDTGLLEIITSLRQTKILCSLKHLASPLASRMVVSLCARLQPMYAAASPPRWKLLWLIPGSDDRHGALQAGTPGVVTGDASNKRPGALMSLAGGFLIQRCISYALIVALLSC